MRRRQCETAALWVVLAAMVIGGTVGCKAVMQDDGKVVFSLATSLTMEQTGPKETDAESQIGIVLDDWLEDALRRTIPQYFGIDSDGDGVIDMSGEIEDETDNDTGDGDVDDSGG